MDGAAFGLRVVDDDEDAGPVEVWPENVATASVFFALETQWAVNDFNGARRGLRYEAITALFLDCQGVASDDRAQVFQGLRVMERAALGTWAALRG